MPFIYYCHILLDNWWAFYNDKHFIISHKRKFIFNIAWFYITSL